VPAAREDDQLGRVCLVTGASSGIGKEIARGLALKRAHVVVAMRDAERGKRVAEELSDDTANPSVESVEVDVASQASVRRFAADFTKRFTKLHVLVNCAAIHAATKERTVDGIERTWATNALGYFLPTVLLLDTLMASAPARIVNVASAAAGGLDLDDVEFDRRPYRGMAAYEQSKQADRMLTWCLAERLRGKGVTANVMHPGHVRTSLLRRGAFAFIFRLGGLFAHSPARGAETAVWLASSRALGDDTGGFYADKKERHCRFRDEEALRRLWALCERMTGATTPYLAGGGGGLGESESSPPRSE
jgi:NAD(P)-dependent dehydrogenase (short-subunit alcohol dehydrogenase family)